jgi:L-arabinonolactonase
MVQVTRIGATTDRLGEAIVWDAEAARLWWADAAAGIVHRLDPVSGQVDSFQTPAPLGALAITRSGRLLLVLADGAYYYDTATGATERYAAVDGLPDKTRLNDSKIDRQGRMVLGGLDLEYKTATTYRSHFYTLGADRRFRPFADGVGITNGPCFSPDGTTLYIADTIRREIYAFDYDVASGRPGNKRLFADDTVLGGMPDGGTVDAQGYLWFAIMTRGVVLRIAPDGTAAGTIDMPAHPTSVAFGGTDLATLYVTTLSQSVNVTVTSPVAGGLFAVTGLGVSGLADVRFAD